MKRILTLLLLLPFVSFAQSDSIITYTEVVPAEGISKEVLFQRARAWVNDAFKSSKDVTQIQDKETGEIAGKAILRSVIDLHAFGKRAYPADYNFTFKIFVKDGRYKYEIGNFDNYRLADERTKPFGVLTSTGSAPLKHPMVSQKNMDDSWHSAKVHVEGEILPLIQSLKSAMQKPLSTDF